MFLDNYIMIRLYNQLIIYYLFFYLSEEKKKDRRIRLSDLSILIIFNIEDAQDIFSYCLFKDISIIPILKQVQCGNCVGINATPLGAKEFS
ncbi:hypothetical protein D3C73_367920 [compost metagenome]